MWRGDRLAILVLLILATGCVTSRKNQTAKGVTVTGLRFIDEFIIPNGLQFRGTTVGGLSGIDYDSHRDLYYIICDDPSAFNPARFYTARIIVRQQGIDSVVFVSVDTFLNAAGKPYPDIRKDRIHSADLEAMRFDRRRQEFIWSSEGQRVIRDSIVDLQDPAIVITDEKGRYKDSFALPANLHVQFTEKGPRHNSVFEGMSFDQDYEHVFVNVEEPLFEDGPKAGTNDSTAFIRILKFNRKLKQCVAQYGYVIGPVPYPPNPPGAFKINGVSDILYLGDEKFIVIERAYSTGRVSTDIKVYLADASMAEDIPGGMSIKDVPGGKLVSKKLLFDMNRTLDFDIFNVEGVSFGPVLPNGRRSLIFVTDNNFNAKEKTQFLLFEMIE